MARFKLLGPIALGLVLAISGSGQSSADQKHQPGAAREIGSGAGTVGTGAAKGAGDVAKGTGKGAVNLVTLHPINAGASIGKGAATAGKDVTVGTVKGTGKVAKGVGRAFTKLF
jgi:hypothetical protein